MALTSIAINLPEELKIEYESAIQGETSFTPGVRTAETAASAFCAVFPSPWTTPTSFRKFNETR